MPVRTLLMLSVALAIAPAIADDASRRSPERTPASNLTATPMPTTVDAVPAPVRKEKRVRQTFPAPKKTM